MSLQTDLGLLLLVAQRLGGHVDLERLQDSRVRARLVLDGQCFVGVGASASHAVRSVCETIEEYTGQTFPPRSRSAVESGR